MIQRIGISNSSRTRSRWRSTRARSGRSSEASGSSSSSARGLDARARAIATRWRSPPESWCARRSEQVFELERLEGARQRAARRRNSRRASRRSAGSARRSGAGRAARPAAPSRGGAARARRRRPRAESSSQVSPRRIRARAAGARPSTASSSVDFPAPLGPKITATRALHARSRSSEKSPRVISTRICVDALAHRLLPPLRSHFSAISIETSAIAKETAQRASASPSSPSCTRA